MKLSCLPVSLFSAIINRQMSLIEWAELGRQIGLDGVDISLLFIENHSPAYLGKLIRGLKEVGIPFHYEDFRPGWRKGAEVSKAMGLYRQQYCGCIYSEKERYLRGR